MASKVFLFTLRLFSVGFEFLREGLTSVAASSGRERLWLLRTFLRKLCPGVPGNARLDVNQMEGTCLSPGKRARAGSLRTSPSGSPNGRARLDRRCPLMRRPNPPNHPQSRFDLVLRPCTHPLDHSVWHSSPSSLVIGIVKRCEIDPMPCSNG